MANADLKVSELPPLAGSQLQPTDPLPIADLSASETVKVTIKDVIQSGIQFVDPGTIPPDRVAGGLKPQPDSITTLELANQAVHADNLNDNSTLRLVATLPATGTYIGQLALLTGTNKVYAWSGSQWLAMQSAGSVNTITGSTAGVVGTTVTTTGDSVVITAELTATTGAGMFLAGPSLAGGAVSARPIIGTDLPLPTATNRGAVAINGGGLKLTGSVLSIDNTVAPSVNAQIVTYNSSGLVTGGRALSGADLPLATALSVGVVKAGVGLSTGVDGALNHSNAVAPGTGSKVTWDAAGHITGGSALTDADIPVHSADKLTSGTLDAARLGAHTITADKLADYAIALIQESVPSAGVGTHPIGMTWLQESTGQVSIWNGNSWMKTGASTLFNRNLRYCGTYNPATGLVTGVTQFGTAEGFKVTDPVPAADDKIAGAYFVASSAGSSSSIAGGASFDAGDWLLCQGTSGGWVRIDTLSGAGGGAGGGTDHLDGLLDVTLTSPKAGDILHYTAAGQWVNVAFTDAGTY